MRPRAVPRDVEVIPASLGLELGVRLVADLFWFSPFAWFIRRELDFYIDEPTGQTVITVRDRETDQVIRQIPSEEILAVAERINEMQQAGLLMQGKA